MATAVSASKEIMPSSSPSVEKQINWSSAVVNLFKKVISSASFEPEDQFKRDIKGIYTAMKSALQKSHPNIVLAANDESADKAMSELYQKIVGQRKVSPEDAINLLVQSQIFATLHALPKHFDLEVMEETYNSVNQKITPKFLEELPSLKSNPIVLEWFTSAIFSIMDISEIRKTLSALKTLPPEISDRMLTGRKKIETEMLQIFIKEDCELLILLLRNHKVANIWSQYRALIAGARNAHGDYRQVVEGSIFTGLSKLYMRLPASHGEPEKKER